MLKTSNFLVPPDNKIKLSDYDPDNTDGFKGKAHAETMLEKHRQKLFELQELLYAEGKRSLLVVLQAMDAGGKDGTIRHIFTGVNPQGCRVSSFKVPTEEELRHDFLWRIHKVVPAAGMIGIFNRSHYEDVLVVRVHGLIKDKEADRRFVEINNFEKLLTNQNTTVLKFFLHISKDEQKKRLEERLRDPKKYWKVNPTDLQERKRWDEYEKAYEDVFRNCSSKNAPWYVIPANKKWFRNVVISQIIVDTLESLDMKYPKSKFDLKKLKVE